MLINIITTLIKEAGVAVILKCLCWPLYKNDRSQKMRVLLIEDEKSTAQLIALTLEGDGITCDRAELGEEALSIVERGESYDIIVLDLMLPDIDGYEVLLKIRADKNKTPALILSGLSSPAHKIKGLSFGADDYMTKPFNHKELLARIHAIVRRSKEHSQSIIRFDKLSINLETREVCIDGIAVHLTNKEYAVLELLALKQGVTVTKEMLLSHIYKGVDVANTKIIDVFICKIRSKLAKASSCNGYIETIWSRGYILKKHPETTSYS